MVFLFDLYFDNKQNNSTQNYGPEKSQISCCWRFYINKKHISFTHTRDTYRYYLSYQNDLKLKNYI